MIFEKYVFHVPVINRTYAQMESIIHNNPFIDRQTTNTEKLYVTFLGDFPKEEAVNVVKQVSFEPDEFTITGKEVYLHCSASYGKTKLSNHFFEKRLNIPATTRNWRTTEELFKIMQQIPLYTACLLSILLYECLRK